jgi:hypothetical protein
MRIRQSSDLTNAVPIKVSRKRRFASTSLPKVMVGTRCFRGWAGSIEGISTSWDCARKTSQRRQAGVTIEDAIVASSAPMSDGGGPLPSPEYFAVYRRVQCHWHVRLCIS